MSNVVICDFCKKPIGRREPFVRTHWAPRALEDNRLGAFFIHQNWCWQVFEALRAHDEDNREFITSHSDLHFIPSPAGSHPTECRIYENKKRYDHE